MIEIACGDSLALEVLYDVHFSLVYGIARKVLAETGNEAIDDVVQTTFVNLWRYAPRYRPGNVRGWLARLARNAALDVARRKRDVPFAFFDWHIHVDTSLEDALFADLDGAVVCAALEALPTQQRILIELGFFDGLSHTQIAQKLEMPVGTVKTRIRAGLMRLRLTLERAGFERRHSSGIPRTNTTTSKSA